MLIQCTAFESTKGGTQFYKSGTWVSGLSSEFCTVQALLGLGNQMLVLWVTRLIKRWVVNSSSSGGQSCVRNIVDGGFQGCPNTGFPHFRHFNCTQTRVNAFRTKWRVHIITEGHFSGLFVRQSSTVVKVTLCSRPRHPVMWTACKDKGLDVYTFYHMSVVNASVLRNKTSEEDKRFVGGATCWWNTSVPTWTRFQNGTSSAMGEVDTEQSEPMTMIFVGSMNIWSMKPRTLGADWHCVCVWWGGVGEEVRERPRLWLSW